LYGCETWSLTLREEQKFGVFENGVLRRIFVPKGEEVVGGCRRLHNGTVCTLHQTLRSMRWAGDVTYMEEIINAYKEDKRLLGRPMHRWEDNIRLDLREIGWEGVEWFYLSQDRAACREKSKELSSSMKGGDFIAGLSDH
jgi:hypothetical protein